MNVTHPLVVPGVQRQAVMGVFVPSRSGDSGRWKASVCNLRLGQGVLVSWPASESVENRVVSALASGSYMEKFVVQMGDGCQISDKGQHSCHEGQEVGGICGSALSRKSAHVT